LKDGFAALFNNNWKFLLGNPKNAQRPDYPDRTWQRIDLPHDWIIRQPFSRGRVGVYSSQNMQGFFAWEGVAWYRKEFTLPDLAGKEVYIYFGGAYRNSSVFINGKEAGGRAYGYSSFELNISGLAREGGNVIAVRLDNGCEAPDRWYSGSGLYRNVYLKIVPLTHIKTWGVHVTPKMTNNGKQAEVEVETAVTDCRKRGVGAVCVKLTGPDGSVVAESSSPFDLAGKKETAVKVNMTVRNPALWSAEEPNLYRAEVCLETGGGTIGGAIGGTVSGTGKPVEVSFGIRAIEIAYRKGMSVNGKPVKLKGVCLHHDCGITGSAYYDSVWRRRLLVLKNIGCNAIRTSHNPPAEEFLDLCDELGFYVIDECFDKWKSGYYAEHFEADARRDLEEFILRDRNHPSVFMWSVGNEVENQGAESMLKIQQTLVSIVRALDGRPVTCALEPHVHPRSLIGAPPEELVKITKKLAKDVDVLGLNYHEPLYRDYTEAIDRPIAGMESYEYYSGTALNYEDVTGKNPWQFVLENDNVIGQFIWAGIDYLGESSWPAKGWAGSILDICGFMKPNAYFRKSIWSDEPTVYLAFYDQAVKPNYARGRWSFPPVSSHLNHDHFHRRTVTAAIYTNCDEVELRINGKKMGRRRPADFANNIYTAGIIEWTFEYAAGKIETVGYRAGKEVCSHILKTAGTAKNILLSPDKTTLAAGGVAHVEISVTDKNGILCPNEEALVDFALTGGGEILGACSPDLNSALGFTLPKVVTSGGRALLMLRAKGGPGTLVLTAYSENLKPASLRFKVK
jgi:beta-galactosidase